MSTDTKSRKIRRLKGSVLFTTLVVMILILLIMLAAIGLAGAASKKAYSTWYDNQTKYTAQDLVDNVIETLGPGKANAALGGNIVSKLQNKGDKVTVDVTVGGDKRIPGYGEVQSMTFENVGTNKGNFTISGLTGHDNEAIIKVSAVVTMGGETSTYSTYVVGEAVNNKSSSNGGGYIALSDLKGGSGSNDAPYTIGRFYSGIDKQIDTTTGANQTLMAGDIFINTKKFTFNAGTAKTAVVLGRNDPTSGYYGGMRITGDLIVENGLLIESQYPPSLMTDLSGENFYNIPYLYVDGELEVKSGGIALKTYNLGSDGIDETPSVPNDDPKKEKCDESNKLLNIYCDHFNFSNSNCNLSGNMNIMTMGENVDNTIKLETSSLTDWAASTISGVTNKGTLESGNFYCKGNFNKSGNGYTINGDLCVVGDLKVSGDITVNNGNVYVGGTIDNPSAIKGSPKIKDNLGKTTATFLQNLKDLDKVKESDGTTKTYPDAASAASRFETAYKLSSGSGSTGTSYVQTLDNVQNQLKDKTDPSNPVYNGVVNTSKNTNGVWNGIGTITTSCVWDNTVCLNGESNKKLSDGIDGTININPNGGEIWIDIDPSLTCINQKTIIMDDTNGGSVRFFIKKKAGNSEDNRQKLDLTKTKFVTKTYYEKLYTAGDFALSSYPSDPKLVPQIYMYASDSTYVDITMSNGDYMFTGDLIAPKAKFTGKSQSNVNKQIDYTYFNYVGDTNNNGVIDADEMKNPINVNRKVNNLSFIGSLEVGEIDVTNLFGYLYVDDPPTGTKPPAISGGFKWTTIDGYSTY